MPGHLRPARLNPSQACDAAGNPITGLYACGEVTGGLHGENRLRGNAIADCVTFGRNAGVQAALNAGYAEPEPSAGETNPVESVTITEARENAAAAPTDEELDNMREWEEAHE